MSDGADSNVGRPGLSLNHLGGGTISGLLEARVATSPEKRFVVTSAGSLTYRQLESATADVACAFRAHGFSAGDHVALMLSNSIEHVVAWLGASRAGLVTVPINVAYRGDLLEYVLTHSESSAIIIDDSLQPNLETAQTAAQKLKLIVAVPTDGGGASIDAAANLVSWEAFRRSGESVARRTALSAVSPTDTCSILYTSGTTGRSKGVVLPHLHNVTMAAEASMSLGVSARDTLYTCLPLFHGNAMMASVLNAMYASATVYLGRRFSVTNFWSEVRTANATEFNVLGPMLNMLLSRPEQTTDQDHSVRTVFAAPAPPDVLGRFESRFGVTIIEGYGQTEIRNVAYNPLHARRPGSFGRPLPSGQLQIIDDAGRAASPGDIGEIVYRPNRAGIILKEYWRDPQATVNAFKDLWWHTGDIGYMDQDGYFYFTDRTKDAIRRRGENISSYEVETVLRSHQHVSDAAVIAVPSEIGEDEVMAVVLLEEGITNSAESLFHFCDSRLPYFMVPRYFRFVDALPSTPNGKVQKSLLRDAGIADDTWDASAFGLTPTR